MAYIKLDSSNLKHNLSQLALKSGSKSRLAVVLKDNAYGHGIREIAKISSDFGIQEAVVADIDEAEEIEKYFKNILILNSKPVPKANFSFAINDLEILNSIKRGSRAKIELKVDTGMHRNGVSISEFSEALEIIKSRELNLVGVMTHFRGADELDSSYFWQKKRFEEIKKMVISKGFEGVRFHSHNSAGLLRAKNFDEDIARVGIALYGYNTLPESFEKLKLKPVLSLWADRVSTKFLNIGDRVGYGGDFIVSESGLYSTYDLGYGDGWPRVSSSYTLPDGRRFLGRVSMDFVIIKGDEESICIMDNAQISAREFKTICYEMTTSLKPQIKRIVV
jgi:alanine racemase